jgi:hypothetical protein
MVKKGEFTELQKRAVSGCVSRSGSRRKELDSKSESLPAGAKGSLRYVTLILEYLEVNRHG